MARTAITATVLLVLAGWTQADVVVLKTPNRGIQPQVVTDAKGNVHLLSYHGDPRGGNLMYTRRDAGAKEFAAPIRVDSQDGSAIAVGTIRGGHLALGKNGRVHVAWNGSMKATPKHPIAGHPMMYARLRDDGASFEPQRNLMTKTSVLDGGGSLAADAQGNVYVAWHALGHEGEKGEEHRQVWISRSSDDGKTFAPEQPAWDEKTGACGCCGMRGFADRKGNAYFLYRAASEKTKRGMYLLHTSEAGKAFAGLQLDQWKIDTCPMSSEALAEGPDGVHAVWDNDGQIYGAQVPFHPNENLKHTYAVPGKPADRKHPALAFNKQGEKIIVWTEGTGWNRGGALVWQVYDKDGTPTESGRRAGAIPVWGLPAVIADRDGRFTIFH